MKYVLSFLLFICTLTILFYPPAFELLEGDITLKYGSKYEEKGFKVTKFGHDYSDKVKIKGNVNENKLGLYELTYETKIFGISFQEKRKIKIIDNEKPVITLNGTDKTICPNTTYEEEGYSAIDNYDGNITDKVVKEINGNIITYTVKDSSLNETIITRTITKEDKTKPEITLKGSQTLTIYKGATWQDPGYIVTDNCDDVSQNVTIEGSVNTNKIGTYKITYNVKDESGNCSSATRTIKVTENKTVKENKGIIYLTFDDGPTSKITDAILDILKEENVKATFFVTASGPDNLIKREYEEGHTVALHTASHNYATIYSSVENYYNDLYQVQNRVKKITGTNSKIIRFPGGSSNTVSKKYSKGIMTTLTKDVLNKGFKYFDWNISSGDAGETKTASGVYNNVIKSLKPNKTNMVLMHDTKTYTKNALKDIIKYGKNNGYTFKKITDDTPMITQKVNN